MINYQWPTDFTVEGKGKALLCYYASGQYLNNPYFEADSLVLEEAICTADQLEFGTCLASSVEFNVGAATNNLPVGQEIHFTMKCSGRGLTLALGHYKVYSNELTGNKVWRKIKAYDKMADILNAEMVDWYNGLFPNAGDTITIKNMRDSFFNYLGITQVTTTLINDDVAVGKTINSTSISGKTIIEAICQINGVFGKIARNGNFKYVSLDSSTRTEIGANGTYLSAECESYETNAIDKVQIRTNENDIGAIVGTGTNALIIENNFLLFGKDSTELTTIATAILNKVSGIVLRPFKAKVLGVPFMEVGDAIRINTANQTIDSYILRRKMTGIQCLFDEMEAKSTQNREEQLNTTNHSLIMLAYKSNELTRTVEETKSTITQILDPTDPTSLQSQITQNAQAITLKVSKGEVSSEISQEAGQITISSNRLVINSTGFTLDANGRATFGSEDTANKLAILDVNDQSTYLIRAQKLKVWSDSQNEWRDSFSVDKDGLVKCQKIEFISTYGTNYIGTDGFTIYGNSFVYGALQVNSLTTNGSNGNITIQGTGTSSCSGKFESKQFAFKNASLSDSYFDGTFKVHDSVYGTVSISPNEISTPATITIKSTNSSNGVVIGGTGDRIAFFGGTVHAKDTVNKLSSSATLAKVITKVNDLLTALKDYNLINST